MWIYLLLLVLLVYALFKERQALGCPDIPNGEDCDNAMGKAIKGSLPLPTDSNSVVYDKIHLAADFADRWVVWRLAYILSIVGVLVAYFFLYYRLPDERELLVSTFVFATIVYFTFNFYKFHLINYARNNVDEGIRILKARSP